ncbi:uncharacterized protein LOC125762381 [Anopheles funestus]|uniref:uncharacterized protein LOC125762381 n=1 Tax=Anopheles funestus TaxID=62324 RepID=UPI0020C6C300|nr:uncharacterized protein LOC125762381 [Anopheles funestus]
MDYGLGAVSYPSADDINRTNVCCRDDVAGYIDCSSRYRSSSGNGGTNLSSSNCSRSTTARQNLSSRPSCRLVSRHITGSGSSGSALSVLPLAATIYGRRPLCSPCGSSCRGSSRSSHSTLPQRGSAWRGYDSLQTGVDASVTSWPLLLRTSTNNGRSVSEGTHIAATEYSNRQYRNQYIQQELHRHPQYQQQQQHQQQQRRRRRRQMKRPLAGICDKGIVAFPDHKPSSTYRLGDSKADYQGFTEDSNAGDGGNGSVGGNSTHHTGTVVCPTQLGPGGGGGGSRYEHHLSRHASSILPSSLVSSPDGNDLPHHTHYQLHHQMSYHNMFTPSREPGTAWRCRSCGKEVTNRWHHFHSHTPQRSLCPYCPASYSRIDTLRSHLRIKHADRLSAPKFSNPPNCKLPM